MDWNLMLELALVSFHPFLFLSNRIISVALPYLLCDDVTIFRNIFSAQPLLNSNLS